MEALAVLVALVVGAVVLILPIVSLVVALDARAKVRRVLASLEAGLPRTERPPSLEAAAAEPAPPAAPVAPGASAEPPAVEPPPVREAPAAPPEVPASSPPALEVEERGSLEERIGVTWFTRIGAAVLVLGALYFFKYAIDNEWIGPWGRVALGLFAGAAVLGLAERQSGRARPAWVAALLGSGVAILFVSAYAAYAFYGLLPLPAAFAALLVVALVGAAAALRHDSQLVLLIALLAALANPVLLSTGQDRPGVLFTYLLAVTSAALWVGLRRGWSLTCWLAAAGFGVLATGWWSRFLDVHPPDPAALPAVPGAATAGAYHALAARLLPLAFAVLFTAQWAIAALAARARGLERLRPTALLLAAVLLGHVGPAALLYDRPLLLGLAMALAAFGAVMLLRRPEETSVLALAPPLAGVVFLIASAGRAGGESTGFLVIATAWALVYLMAGAGALLRRPAAPANAAALLASVGPLGLVAVVLAATTNATLQALFAAAGGAALFALGHALLGARPEERTAATVLLGEGVALVALALGLALSGVTLTLVWALLAAAVTVVAAREHEPRWLTGAVLLFLLTLGRLLAFDLQLGEREHARFMSTLGAEGSFQHLPAVLNARALALAGVALALAIAAWALKRYAASKDQRALAAISATLAHALVLGLVLSEGTALLLQTPVFPGAADQDELWAWVQANQPTQQEALRLAVARTLILGGYGGALLLVGFAARSVLHRWLGLVLLGITLAKLGLWDVWNLPRLHQILVLLAVGALLLGAGFLYARFGRRLLRFLGATGGVLLLTVSSAFADGLDPSRFPTMAALEVAAPGWTVIEVPLALFRASAEGGRLSDVRLRAPDGSEVGWLLREAPGGEPPRELATEMLDPVVLPDGATRASFDLGPGEHRHDEVALQVSGESFMRKARVEVSDDRRQWGAIGEALVYRAVRNGATSEQLTVGYPTSAARYLRITLAGVAGEEPLPLTAGRVRVRSGRPAPPSVPVPLALLRQEESGAHGRTSAWVLDAGDEGVPLQALRLTVRAPAAFARPVEVEAASREGMWVQAGGGLALRAAGVESLRLGIDTQRRYLRLLVRDGDDPPLSIAAVEGEHRPRQIVFLAATAGEHLLLAGAAGLPAPRYDVAAVLGREPTARLQPARLGELRANPDYRPGDDGVKPWSERARVPIALTLAVLLLGLAAWAVRSLRASA